MTVRWENEASWPHFTQMACTLETSSAQSRHRTEWNTPEVHVQSGNNDAYTIVGKLVAYINQAAIKELGFVNAHYIYL